MHPRALPTTPRDALATAGGLFTSSEPDSLSPDPIMPDSLLLAPIGIALDRLLGEPARYHPLIGFGRLAERVEARLYGDPALKDDARRRRGALAVACLLLPAGLVSVAIERLPGIGSAAAIAGLYLAVGARSLREHAEAVHDALAAGRLETARVAVGRIVSRDIHRLNEGQIAAATVESVLENGCDAIFGALFWFAVGGLPGVVVYRLANTLDAMWGYRNERYHAFGWAAARLDDVLNWPPARLTALSYAAAGDAATACRAWRRQGSRWNSPNAGPVMAAGAGALRLRLGGPAFYHGRLRARPNLGEGEPAETRDIPRALALVRRALWLWLGVMLAGGWLRA